MRCPGQDWRYWKGGVAFEIPCPRCNSPVEFFKDENTQRCRACGHRFANPKKSLECAQWCAYAEECTGAAASGPVDAESGFASGLVLAVEKAFPEDPRQAEALLIFQHAKQLLAEAGADPRCVLAAAILLPFVRSEPEACLAGTQAAGRLTEILRNTGLEEHAIQQVWTLLRSWPTPARLDTADSRILRDADRLARMTCETGAQRQRALGPAQAGWETETARNRARLLFDQ
ncbi:MAG: hypothetical protein HUU20_01990 [Pirellulales bacterium]|nr:hypothetical protein [Pirellulales bacterium]